METPIETPQQTAPETVLETVLESAIGVSASKAIPEWEGLLDGVLSFARYLAKMFQQGGRVVRWPKVSDSLCRG